eukprot:4795908-Prymnesium_polylepis.1
MKLRQAGTRLTAAAVFAICAADGEVWSRCRLESVSHCCSSEYCDGTRPLRSGQWQRTAVSALGAIEVDLLQP